MPYDRSQIRKGAYLQGGQFPATVVEERRPPPRYEEDDDPAAEFDARIKRANDLLDQIAAVKAAKAKADHEDFRDIIWRVGCR